MLISILKGSLGGIFCVVSIRLIEKSEHAKNILRNIDSKIRNIIKEKYVSVFYLACFLLIVSAVSNVNEYIINLPILSEILVGCAAGIMSSLDNIQKYTK